MLHIQLFGHVSVSRGEGLSEISLPPIGQTLFVYLLLHPHRFLSREVLAELAWGDRSETQAHSCLNTALWRLRRILETDQRGNGYLITTATGEVGFNWQSDHWLDLTTFEQCAARVLSVPLQAMQPEHATRLENILPLYRGELLEGVYEDWALRERERLHATHLDCLARLMCFHREKDYERSLHFGRLILDQDPLREEIHREMMRLYHANGQRALAVRQYESCRDVLAKELGVPPMEETQDLYAKLTDSVAPPSFGGHRAPSPAREQEPATLSQAVDQLNAALHSFEAAHAQLEQAARLVQRLGRDQASRS